ncbi:MAG: MFS transporter [Myxococcales bacterium]|jgi:OPA family glycerol-3-phosphate transporter-like MFS transporter|nr:MFS transporter [Myxococcales bacterium]
MSWVGELLAKYTWLRELLPIVGLLVVIVLVVHRLPRVDLGHSPAFLRRRFFNWFPVGLTYAFLYMARYNSNACIGLLFDKKQYFEIDSWGALTYGLSFILNGPLTDRLGGRKTTILAAVGAGAANVAIGVVAMRALGEGGRVPKEAWAGLVPTLSVLYAVNMYFQSFGAVSIVKVNAAWFHLRERGTFGGIFGILISLGLYFAFDWCSFIAKRTSVQWVFFVPAAILFVLAVVDFFLVRDTPHHAGHADFDLGDASSGDTGERLSVWTVASMMLRNPAIVTIAIIEFCSGFLRNAIMKTYKPFAEETGRAAHDFVQGHWGMLNCVAGILGGVVAGLISDRFFSSRRGPMAAVLYAVMLAGSGVMALTLRSASVGWVLLVMTLAIIGVHGMLSGTASMDFGGKRNVGIVVGVIDGFVYLGSTVGSRTLKSVLPSDAAAKDPGSWWTWPAAIAPLALVGFVLALRVWNARPASSKSAAAH